MMYANLYLLRLHLRRLRTPAQNIQRSSTNCKYYDIGDGTQSVGPDAPTGSTPASDDEGCTTHDRSLMDAFCRVTPTRSEVTCLMRCHAPTPECRCWLA